ncbi:MAG: serine/threonine-protein kinase [Candidatus Melainabacteria bacterium]|nr:serine/threonine-protein kinase [Candidatus Melainabacteria bacterium]
MPKEFPLKPHVPSAKSNAVIVQCRLLPLGTALLICAGTFMLSVFFWVITGGAAGVWSVLLQIFVLITVILTSVNLKVVFSESGLLAANQLHKDSLFKRSKRGWDDLHSVRLHKLYDPSLVLRRLTVNRDKKNFSIWDRLRAEVSGGWSRQGFLILDFRSGGAMPMPIAGIPDAQLEELFVALSRWSDPMALNADVIALQRDVLMGEPVCLSSSYTKMWEDELRKRFEVTNFVPLPGGHRIRDGEIQVLMQLACGGMSSVYLARRSSGERIILKELVVPEDRDGSMRARVTEMFSREARLLAALDHPQIVKVYDHFLEDGRNYLILEHAKGLNLRQIVGLEGVFAEKTVLKIARQLAEIVDYLHSRNPALIHRDITPDNLVYDAETGLVTLIDFGAASEFVGNMTGTLVGKQCYLPPEQFRGKAEPASDIYAIGGTMHFMLTGEDPVPITSCNPRLLNDKLSEELSRIIEHATAQEVEDRISNASELSQQLALV